MSKALKGKLSRCSLVKATTEGVIRCDPYDKLDGPFFEKYVREQFLNFLGKQTRMWYHRSKIVIEQITSGCKKPTSCLLTVRLRIRIVTNFKYNYKALYLFPLLFSQGVANEYKLCTKSMRFLHFLHIVPHFNG